MELVFSFLSAVRSFYHDRYLFGSYQRKCTLWLFPLILSWILKYLLCKCFRCFVSTLKPTSITKCIKNFPKIWKTVLILFQEFWQKNLFFAFIRSYMFARDFACSSRIINGLVIPSIDSTNKNLTEVKLLTWKPTRRLSYIH